MAGRKNPASKRFFVDRSVVDRLLRKRFEDPLPEEAVYFAASIAPARSGPLPSSDGSAIFIQ
jgi:hypothetical protein